MTVPLPVPVLLIVSANWGVGVGVGVGAAKTAVTDWAEFIVTLQVPVPEHPPLQPVNVDPPLGVAVNVTAVPTL